MVLNQSAMHSHCLEEGHVPVRVPSPEAPLLPITQSLHHLPPHRYAFHYLHTGRAATPPSVGIQNTYKEFINRVTGVTVLSRICLLLLHTGLPECSSQLTEAEPDEPSVNECIQVGYLSKLTCHPGSQWTLNSRDTCVSPSWIKMHLYSFPNVIPTPLYGFANYVRGRIVLQGLSCTSAIPAFNLVSWAIKGSSRSFSLPDCASCVQCWP